MEFDGLLLRQVVNCFFGIEAIYGKNHLFLSRAEFSVDAASALILHKLWMNAYTGSTAAYWNRGIISKGSASVGTVVAQAFKHRA